MRGSEVGFILFSLFDLSFSLRSQALSEVSPRLHQFFFAMDDHP